MARLTVLVCLAVVLSGCGQRDEVPAGFSSRVSGVQKFGNSGDSVAEIFPNVEKPKRIHVLVDDSIYTMENGRTAFEQAWERLYGIDLVIDQHDNAGYEDVVDSEMDSKDLPDAILMSANQYAKYAISSKLYDMTYAFQGSALEQRIEDAGSSEYLDRYRLETGHLYGIPPQNPGGAVTYIKKSWLRNVHKKVPTNYEEFLDLMRAFSEEDPDGNGIDGDTYAISSPDLNDPIYLPQLYQTANVDFFQDEDGIWHDGFVMPEMRQAMSRLQNAYALGYIDPDVTELTTQECLDRFYDDQFGILTFNAGIWANTLEENLIAAGQDGDLIAIPPIAEAEYYQEKAGKVWVIPKNSSNPDGVYHYFLETMLDGGQTQMLWTYGAEGFHWDEDRENVLGTAYSNGEFHMKENFRSPGKTYPTNLLNPWNAICQIENDPSTSMIYETQMQTIQLFEKYKKPSQIIRMNRRMALYETEVRKEKKLLLSKVASCKMSWNDAMTEYERSGAKELAQRIVTSMNLRDQTN